MNLSHKFILLLLSMIVFIVSLYTYLYIQEDERTFSIQLENRVAYMKKELLKNAKDTSMYYRNEIENDLASMNLSHISHIFKQLVKREDIEGVALVSQDNKMQLFEGRPYHKQVTKETIEENPDNIVIATPIVLSKIWGSFTLVYSLDALEKEIRHAKEISQMKKKKNIQNAVMLAVLIFVVFSIFVFFWAKRLIYPILLLTKSAEKMADGELEANEALSHIDRHDEVGTLAKTFQTMSKKLERSYNELRQVNESLEQRIQERTKDLEQSRDDLKVLSSLDPMTKLYNRRHFSEVSEEMFVLNKQAHENISLIMLDIDNFKNINDTYGHSVGDKVIIKIAEILLKHTRQSDVVCRYGGEEYMILLEHTALMRCQEMAESIRLEVENIVIALENSTTLKVTISIGIAKSDMLVDTHLEIAINKADNALYEAKRSGKNKVIVYNA